ncbi:MAG: DUF4198 domain-containing protein [Pseudomonadota bacterium]
MRLLNSAFTTVCLILSTAAAAAHEFWIEPQAYQIQPGAEIKADLRVGEEFSGSSYPYRPSQITRFDLLQNDETREVTARIGDNPALAMPVTEDGLLIIVHETADSRLTYTKFQKFEKFVAHKAFPDVIAQHDARGISREKFVETYRRYAKSLVAVGDGKGADGPVGLKTEIVALANPYVGSIEEMPVQVLLDGAPRTRTQVELFEKSPDGKVNVTLHMTDGDGKAILPVKPDHSYLVDAVWAEALPNDDAEAGPVWKTHWAALTFQVAK